MPRTLQIAISSGITLHAYEWANESEETGRPMLLVHGLASNARLWDGVARELSARGHRVVAVDLRGHGRSTKPSGGYDFATITDDVRAVVDYMGGEKPVVAGQSWGGNVVIALAARFPGLTHAVACVDGGSIELSDEFPTWEQCAERLAPPHLEGMLAARLEEALRAAHPDWPDTGITSTLANFEVRDDGTVRPWLSRANHMTILRALWEQHPRDLYPLIAEPVLMIAAKDAHSPTGKEAAVERAITLLRRGSALWIVGDHDLHAQHPIAIADALEALA
jgi:pimeloyl-ACP methyl ester carboxylesterase